MCENRPTIRLSVADQVATITLDNPARHNALGKADIEQLIARLHSIRDDPGIRVMILTGSGDRTFCAGASLEELGSGVLSGELFEALTDALTGVPVPKICAFNGSAYGGGVELGLCCDFRIGVEGMRAFVPAARFGLCYPVNGIRRYVQRLGLDTAKRLLVASEEFDAGQLLGIGYLTQLVAREDLEARATEMARSIAALAPLAVGSMLEICDRTADCSVDLERALALVRDCADSDDLREGLRAARENRPPGFKGR